MLNASIFGKALKKYGFNFFSGVPCSYLKGLINYAVSSCEYVMAANEGDAVAICSGAHLGGRKSVVLMQNSGLTNAISPLSSLNYVFKIPVLGFIGMRGEEDDEPQHDLMGKITKPLLGLMGINWDYLSDDFLKAEKQIEKAAEDINENKSFLFLVRKDTFGDEKLISKKSDKVKKRRIILKKEEDSLPKRADALNIINKSADKKTFIFSTTGFTGRELYEIADSDNKFYMIGSMGCVSSLALGASLAAKDKNVIAVDGDGSLLMRMGSLAVNARYGRGNMLHILLDNNMHESTGGQATVSDNVDFVGLAYSAGYEYCNYVCNLNDLENEIIKWEKNKNESLTFLYMKISKGVKENLGRPKLKPIEVKERLMRFVKR